MGYPDLLLIFPLYPSHATNLVRYLSLKKVSISNVEAGRGEEGGVAEGQRGVPVLAEEAAAQVGPVHGVQLAAGGYPII